MQEMGVVGMAENSWTKTLELPRQDRLSAKKELALKGSMFRLFLVTQGKAVEVDKERWLWGLINFLLIASYFSVKESECHQLRQWLEQTMLEVGGERLIKTPRTMGACISSGKME